MAEAPPADSARLYSRQSPHKPSIRNAAPAINPTGFARSVACAPHMHAQSPPPRIGVQRLKRIALWALLMLSWIAAVLGGATPKRRHLAQRGDARLDEMTRLVRSLVILRAVEIAPPRRTRRTLRFTRPRRQLQGLVRTCAGSALRRALRARDPLQRVQRLLAALRQRDVLAARLLRRLKRGLTRLAPIAAAARNQTLRTLSAPPPCAADSS